MKIILSLLVVFFVVASVAWADEQFDFRNAKWGMSREEVKKTEQEKIVGEDENTIGYESGLAGKGVLLVYIFVEDKLVRAKYVLAEDFTNKNDYYDGFFDNVKKLLTEKYGKPSKNDKIWRNNLYRNDRQNLGMAIAVGHFLEFSKWSTPSTDIIAFIHGNNYKISTGIEYVSKEFEKLEEAAIKKKTLGKI